MGPSRFVRTSAAAVWNSDAHDATDDQLLSAACHGDPRAFTLMYHRYELDVWRLAWFTLHHEQDAEDAVQETWVKAHRSLAHCHDGALRPWLLAICRNVCRDRLRSARRHETLPLTTEVAALRPGDPERDLDFRLALRALPESEREAFVLVDVLGCHSDEAARIAGLTASSTLRSRLARARRALVPEVTEPAAARGGDLWGVMQNVRDSVVVVASGGSGPPPEFEVLGGDGADLLGFLDALDARIPATRSVLAVMNARPASRAAITATWLADHRRWHIRRADTHATWVSEVDDLLARWHPCTTDERDALRRQLALGSPIAWAGHG